jgi:hypothetical protein
LKYLVGTRMFESAPESPDRLFFTLLYVAAAVFSAIIDGCCDPAP